jgi:hypothetical protein
LEQVRDAPPSETTIDELCEYFVYLNVFKILVMPFVGSYCSQMQSGARLSVGQGLTPALPLLNDKCFSLHMRLERGLLRVGHAVFGH